MWFPAENRINKTGVLKNCMLWSKLLIIILERCHWVAIEKRLSCSGTEGVQSTILSWTINKDNKVKIISEKETILSSV